MGKIPSLLSILMWKGGKKKGGGEGDLDQKEKGKREGKKEKKHFVIHQNSDLDLRRRGGGRKRGKRGEKKTGKEGKKRRDDLRDEEKEKKGD